MSTQRMIKDSFWTDSYIANLDPTEKLLFLYLLTNPLCNIAGAYEIQLRRIAFDTGIDKDMVEKLLARLETDGKIVLEGEWIILVNHEKHQSNTNPNVKKGIVRIINALPDKVKGSKGFERVSHLTLLNLTLPNGNSEAVAPLSETLKEVPVKKPATPNAVEVFEVFQTVLGKLPANWFGNKTQRTSAQNLYTERGTVAIKNALEFYQTHKDVEFCPQVSAPSDLDAKWSKLGEFKKKLS